MSRMFEKQQEASEFGVDSAFITTLTIICKLINPFSCPFLTDLQDQKVVSVLFFDVFNIQSPRYHA